ncbi:MAG: tRNA (adenosine(37)-N6)-threonylcarbamoyltransferase complex ATPase subunit type 1 TsaE [Deltaproteobacteria bacterium]|nr:tRNA (adenosine(37)-N6)-threonylcarbamoyltransferase complex ATPase subunit type 1 TsaE [Deltaproteobacteria bacterium]
MELAFTTNSAQETAELGEAMGRSITAPVVIALTGDLGSGKTVFVQGLARGLSVPDEYYVTSPSYTLINAYPGRLPLYHADLYRLEGGADLEDLELDDLAGGEGVVAIEWAERIELKDLEEHVSVRILTAGESYRVVYLSGTGQSHSDLLKETEKRLREPSWR